MGLYRKLPVVVSAEKWDGTRDEALRLGMVCDPGRHPAQMTVWGCMTLERFVTATPGDWIVMGVVGEKYPCKPEVFKLTYEEVQPGLL